MPESIQTQVAVLATNMKTMMEETKAERLASEKFRDEMRIANKETNTKLSSMQTSLDMAKGGWIVLATIGGIAAWFSGMFSNLSKVFHA